MFKHNTVFFMVNERMLNHVNDLFVHAHKSSRDANIHH